MSNALIALILIGVGVLCDRFYVGCVHRASRASIIAAYTAGHEEGRADPEMAFGPDVRAQAEVWIDQEIRLGTLPNQLHR